MFGCPSKIKQEGDGTCVALPGSMTPLAVFADTRWCWSRPHICPRCHNAQVVRAKRSKRFELCWIPLVSERAMGGERKRDEGAGAWRMAGERGQRRIAGAREGVVEGKDRAGSRTLQVVAQYLAAIGKGKQSGESAELCPPAEGRRSAASREQALV